MKRVSMVQTTTYIADYQKEWLWKNSYTGKKSEQKEDELSFSEHIRKALDDYMEKIT